MSLIHCNVWCMNALIKQSYYAILWSVENRFIFGFLFLTKHQFQYLHANFHHMKLISNKNVFSDEIFFFAVIYFGPLLVVCWYSKLHVCGLKYNFLSPFMCRFCIVIKIFVFRKTVNYLLLHLKSIYII